MAYVEFKTGVIKPVEVYKEAWAMIKDQFWMVLAVTLVGIMVGSVIPVVLIGPMMCGIYLVLFQVYEGRTVDFALLFKGFDYFVPSLILAVIIMVPTIILLLTMYIPMIGIAMAGPNLSESEAMAAIGGVLLVVLIEVVVMVGLHSFLIFSFPLIVDKKMSAVGSIKTSARAVWHNLTGIGGLYLVGFGVALVGYLMLCIGIYLALPLIIAANLVAYRKVFPAAASPSV